jgi:hypothetical protein
VLLRVEPGLVVCFLIEHDMGPGRARGGVAAASGLPFRRQQRGQVTARRGVGPPWGGGAAHVHGWCVRGAVAEWACTVNEA